MTRAILYVRVSTDQQAEVGVSLEAQESRLTDYARAMQYDVVDVIVDAGVSAKSIDRPGLKRALEMLRTDAADALIVVKLDRLTRSTRDLLHLVETVFQKSALISMNEQIDTRSAAGRLLLTVMAAMAQWERETIGERTSAAMQHMKSQGLRAGAIPYGYRLAADGVSLEEDSKEQEMLVIARRMRAANYSLRTIAKHLELRGYTSRRGSRVATSCVARMVAA